MTELTMREIQLVSLEILHTVATICEEQNFRYSLIYGTLIGAIRHHGYIPWDDDVDIWMPRPDYEKFVKYCIDNDYHLNKFSTKTILIQMIIIIVYLNPCNQYV